MAPTSGVNDEPTVPAAHCEAFALDTQTGNLALLEYVLEPSEMLNLPDKLALKVFTSIDTFGLDSPSFQAHSVKTTAEGAGFLDDMEGCCESCCVILHVACICVPAEH